jgi:UDP-N-acetyl-D-glucosamine dehydrogenase
MELFKGLGAEVAYHDPHVPIIRPTREHGHWAGTKSVAWDKATIGAFDAVIVATAHKAVNHANLAEWSHCIVDTRNAMKGVSVKPGQLWKA